MKKNAFIKASFPKCGNIENHTSLSIIIITNLTPSLKISILFKKTNYKITKNSRNHKLPCCPASVYALPAPPATSFAPV